MSAAGSIQRVSRWVEIVYLIAVVSRKSIAPPMIRCVNIMTASIARNKKVRRVRHQINSIHATHKLAGSFGLRWVRPRHHQKAELIPQNTIVMVVKSIDESLQCLLVISSQRRINSQGTRNIRKRGRRITLRRQRTANTLRLPHQAPRPRRSTGSIGSKPHGNENTAKGNVPSGCAPSAAALNQHDKDKASHDIKAIGPSSAKNANPVPPLIACLRDCRLTAHQGPPLSAQSRHPTHGPWQPGIS